MFSSEIEAKNNNKKPKCKGKSCKKMTINVGVTAQGTVTQGSCDTSAVWNKSCSPKWCVFDTNAACLFETPSYTYASDLAALSCKQCTQSTSSVCSASALKATLKVST